MSERRRLPPPLITRRLPSGAAAQAPLSALALVLELTGNTVPIVVPMVVATALATLVVRQVDGYSIYSARLPRRDATSEPWDAVHA